MKTPSALPPTPISTKAFDRTLKTMVQMCSMERALRAVMDTPHFHDMEDSIQAQVLAALGKKTSHTAKDFDSGDLDPYTTPV